MSAYEQVILWLGLGEAGILMVGALAMAFWLCTGLNDKFQRVAENWFPALAVLVVGTVAAAIILAATHWLIAP
jgi:uncharacterized membrane protein